MDHPFHPTGDHSVHGFAPGSPILTSIRFLLNMAHDGLEHLSPSMKKGRLIQAAFVDLRILSRAVVEPSVPGIDKPGCQG